MSLPVRLQALLVFGCAVLLATTAYTPNTATAQDKAKDAKPIMDYTDVSLDKLAIKTSFLVGGKNDTALIRKLTHINGIAVAELEKVMRPGQSSLSGFLGEDEALLAVMATDNDLVLGELKVTHQEVARHLQVLGAVGAKAEPDVAECTYHGKRFKIKVISYRGYQTSPFKDGTRTNQNATVENLDTGKKLTFSRLVPDMIERYGFYEGKGTPYRVDPRKVVDVLDFLKDKQPKKE
jgi:hypothetical protein